MSRTEYSQERQEAALELLRAGKSVREVAAASGYSYPHIRNLASAEGISLATQYVGPRILEALALIRSGLSNAEIGRKLKCSRERIRNIKNEAMAAGALSPEDLK